MTDLDGLITQAHELLDQAITEHVTGPGKELAGVALLFSGGRDSTTLAHLFKDRATVAIHANTGIGIEATREFVRATCSDWRIPLLEKHPPTSYRDLVLDQGFPGPAHHWKMYQRLKERGLRQARAEIGTGRDRRVIFLAGRRRTESARRIQVPDVERIWSVVWVSPLVDWTTSDLLAYQARFTVPINEVSQLLHMSGECLCGSFAHTNELEEIGYWYPLVQTEIEKLEAAVLQAGSAPPWRCRWGWGADKDAIVKLQRQGWTDDQIATQFARSESGPLCGSCGVGR